MKTPRTTKPAAKKTAAAMDKTVRAIAAKHLSLTTLDETRTGADFREQAVWTIRAALEAAYEAGRAAR